jgi:hypothetical protein
VDAEAGLGNVLKFKLLEGEGSVNKLVLLGAPLVSPELSFFGFLD